MTPEFGSADELEHYPDTPSPTMVMDPDADFRQAPSPVYIRAKQMASGQSIESAWTPAITVWLQRTYNELCIGRRTIVDLSANTNTNYWIDEDGNRVAPSLSYWDNHPIFGGIIAQKYTDPAGLFEHDMRFMPPFYAKGRTIPEADPTGMRIHDTWIKPMPFKDGGYIYPSFRIAPNGLLISACLCTPEAPAMKSVIGTAATNINATAFDSNITALNAGTQEIRKLDFYANRAMYLLCGIENCILGASSLVGTATGVTNNDASIKYRGWYSFRTSMQGTASGEHVAGISNQVASGNASISVLLGLPENVASVVKLSEPITRPGNTNVAWASEIYTGFNEALGCDMELFFMGKNFTGGSQDLYNVSNAPGSSRTDVYCSGESMGLGTSLYGYGASFGRFMVPLG
jgi:hypothetical protein